MTIGWVEGICCGFECLGLGGLFEAAFPAFTFGRFILLGGGGSGLFFELTSSKETSAVSGADSYEDTEDVSIASVDLS